MAKRKKVNYEGRSFLYKRGTVGFEEEKKKAKYYLKDYLSKLKERLERIDNKIYNLNAFISVTYISQINKPDLKGYEKINEYLSDIIKEIRDIHERIETEVNFEMVIKGNNNDIH